MKREFDLLILGAGPTGLRAAVEAARLGRCACLIERDPELGGAGVNTGTIPSKTLRETSLHYSGFLQRGLYGVDFSLPRDRISVAQLMVRKQQVLAAEHQEIRRSLHDLHVQIYRGHGSFLDAHTVQVKTADGQTCDLRGEFVLLATGS